MKDFFEKKTLYSIISTFRDTNKSFKLDESLLKTVKKYKFSFGYSNPQDQKIIFEFGKEMKLKIKQKRRKSPRDESLISLTESSAIMASGISKKNYHLIVMSFVIEENYYWKKHKLEKF